MARPPVRPPRPAKLPDAGLLEALESYYDAAPREGAVEQIGPFTLFNRPRGRPSYARPSLGASVFTAADVQRVAERQRALGLPEAFEWVKETTPALNAAMAEAGLVVGEHPLLVLTEPLARAVAPDVLIRLTCEEDDSSVIGAVAEVAFAYPGTARGPQGVAEMLARVAAKAPDPARPRGGSDRGPRARRAQTRGADRIPVGGRGGDRARLRTGGVSTGRHGLHRRAAPLQRVEQLI